MLFMVAPKEEHRVHIDRIEDALAVLVLEDDTELLVPRRLLPAQAIEGTWLNLRLTIDEDETEARRRSVKERRERLGASDDGGDIEL